MGRRSAGSAARDDILDAAVERFSEDGLEGASVRAIASQAGVDPALVRHYFGNKDGLFTAVITERVQLLDAVGEAVTGDPLLVGERLTRAYLDLWETPERRQVFKMLVHSGVNGGDAVRLMGSIFAALYVEVGGEAPPRPAVAQGLALAGSQLFGLAFSRYVLELPPISELSLDEIVDLVSPAITAYVAPVLAD